MATGRATGTQRGENEDSRMNELAINPAAGACTNFASSATGTVTGDSCGRHAKVAGTGICASSV